MFYLDEVRPRVFLATFHDHYTLCMTFLRVSESVEDSNFADQVLSLEAFRELYSKQGADLNFTYAEDWAGFNLTSESIEETYRKGVPDLNKWDRLFSSIYTMCRAQYPAGKFSIIGISREFEDLDPTLYPHELAHALYYTNEEYRSKVDKEFNKVPDKPKELILQILSGWGYSNNTLVDELHAYLATGFKDLSEFEILDSYENLQQIKTPFQELYKEYSESSFRRRTLYPQMGTWS